MGEMLGASARTGQGVRATTGRNRCGGSAQWRHHSQLREPSGGDATACFCPQPGVQPATSHFRRSGPLLESEKEHMLLPFSSEQETSGFVQQEEVDTVLHCGHCCGGSQGWGGPGQENLGKVGETRGARSGTKNKKQGTGTNSASSPIILLPEGRDLVFIPAPASFTSLCKAPPSC